MAGRKIKVYDKENTRRYLGYFDENDWPDYPGNRVRMATLSKVPPMPTFEAAMNEPFEFNTVEFDKFWRMKDRVTKRLSVMTDAPLKYLMRIRGFNLPGENYRDADERRWRQGYV